MASSREIAVGHDFVSKLTAAIVALRSHRMHAENMSCIFLTVVWLCFARAVTNSSGSGPARNRTFVYIISSSVGVFEWLPSNEMLCLCDALVNDNVRQRTVFSAYDFRTKRFIFTFRG